MSLFEDPHASLVLVVLTLLPGDPLLVALPGGVQGLGAAVVEGGEEVGAVVSEGERDLGLGEVLLGDERGCCSKEWSESFLSIQRSMSTLFPVHAYIPIYNGQRVKGEEKDVRGGAVSWGCVVIFFQSWKLLTWPFPSITHAFTY